MEKLELQMEEMKEDHELEIEKFQNMMVDLKKSYDQREQMYIAKIKKVKLDHELSKQELTDQIESLNRQIKFFKTLKNPST
jgi:hypothetical protein